MKKLAIFFLLFKCSIIPVFAQNEISHSHLRERALVMIKNSALTDLLEAYDTKGFSQFTKMTYQNGIFEGTIFVDSKESFMLLIEEIRKSIPNDPTLISFSSTKEDLGDEYITECWTYFDSSGKKYEVRVYFFNSQLNNLGYWIYQ